MDLDMNIGTVTESSTGPTGPTDLLITHRLRPVAAAASC